MSLTDIREQIKSILAGIDGIGAVHDYERWSKDWNKFLDHYKSPDGRINGWSITRDRTSEECDTSSHHTRIHHFTIRGFYGLKDSEASELTFQGLIEDICEAFRSKYQLNETVNDNSPIQVEAVEPRMFGGVLCHFCELSLTAEELPLAWS